MDDGTRLTLLAIVLGLRKSGQLGGHALAVIADELRYAARNARDMLLDYEGTQIERLADELHSPCDMRPVAQNGLAREERQGRAVD